MVYNRYLDLGNGEYFQYMYSVWWSLDRQTGDDAIALEWGQPCVFLFNSLRGGGDVECRKR